MHHRSTVGSISAAQAVRSIQEPIGMPPPPPPPSGASVLPARTLKESSTNQAIVLPMSTTITPLKMSSDSPTELKVNHQDVNPPPGPQAPAKVGPTSEPTTIKTEIQQLPERSEVFHNNLPPTLTKENSKKCAVKVSKLQERRRKQQQQQQQQQQMQQTATINNNNNNNNISSNNHCFGNSVASSPSVEQRCGMESSNQQLNGKSAT